MRNVTAPLAQLPDPLHGAIGTVGASVHAPVAEIVSSGHAVPLWQLAPFAAQRPAGEIPVDVPPPLRAAVLAAGWEGVADNLVKRVIDVPGRFAQTAFFGSYNHEFLVLMAPIGPSEDGRVAPEYRDGDFAPSELEAMGDMTMLVSKYPATTPPSALGVNAAAAALMEYAANRTVTPPPGAVDAYQQPIATVDSYWHRAAAAALTPSAFASTTTATDTAAFGASDPTRWLPPPPVAKTPPPAFAPPSPMRRPSPPVAPPQT